MPTLVIALLVTATPAVAAVSNDPAGFMTQPTFSTSVDIVQDRTGCTIIYPATDPAWRELAGKIADGLEALGATRVPLLADTHVIPHRLGGLPPDLKDRPLILLGDLNSNRAVFPFYANYYTYCDAMYPGGDGYELRTIVRPFGGPANCLMLGAATIDGGRAGVQQLLKRLSERSPGPNVALPYILDVKLGTQLETLFESIIETAFEQDPSPPTPEFSAALGAATAGESPPDTSGKGQTSRTADLIDYGVARDRFTSYAHLYFYTGREDLARRARDWGYYLANRGEKDERGIRIADYTMENLAAAWRRVSPAPVFTPEQRLLIDTRMYETVAKNSTAWWRQPGAIAEIGGRHHTTGMLAWWTLIRCVLEVGQPDETARAQLLRWRSEAEGYLDGLLRHYWDDLDDYQSADSAQITLSYALRTGKLEWFHSGLAHQAAQKLLSLTDSMGWYVGVQGYGEAIPGWERFTLNGGLLLGACGFVYEDGGYKWLLDRYPGLASSWGALQPWGLHQYATGDAVEARRPAWITGMQILRLPPYRIDLLNQGVFLNSPLMDGFAVAGLRIPDIQESVAFDKIVLRGGDQPDSAFLLLQGMSGIALSTIDMNSLIRYTDQGKIWLIHNTGRMSLFFKNAVYISNGLNDEPVPAACELIASAESDDVQIVSSRLPNYRGTDWTRNLIFCGDRFTVVIDQIQTRKADEYIVSCNWRTPGWASLDDTGWTARQEDVVFHLLPGQLDPPPFAGTKRMGHAATVAGETIGMESRRFTSSDGATRPTVLRQNRRFNARAGESLSFENLIYTTSPRRKQGYAVRRVAPGVLAIESDKQFGERNIVVFARSDGIDLGGVATDALAGFISSRQITLAGATYLRIGDHVERRVDRGAMNLAIDAEAQPELAGGVDTFLADYGQVTTEDAPQADAAHSHRSAANKQGHPAPSPAWTHAGPSTRGNLIDGLQISSSTNLHGSTVQVTDWMYPTLVAEPRLSPQRGSGLAFEPAKHMQRSGEDHVESDLEPLLDPAAGSMFTIALPQPARISEVCLTGKTDGSIREPMPPATLRVELTFSSDGFAQDQRTHTLTLNRQTRYHNLYKGHAYAFETYRAGGLDESASAVRVRVLDSPEPRLPLNDVQIRTTDAVGIQPVELRAMDITGDGADEILSWSDSGELVLLNASGKDVWKRDFGETIVTVDAWDLEHDNRKEIFVSLNDWRVIVLETDGSTRWERFWGHMRRDTDGKFYSDGSLVYGMAAWQRQGAAEKQVLLTSYYFAARLDRDGNPLECFRRSGHHTQIREIPSGLPNAGGLVTRSDIPWTGPVPLEWLDPRTGEIRVSINVPNGPAVLLEVSDFTANGHAEAVVATEQGMGLYSADEPHVRWEHRTEAALTGAAAITGQKGQPARFVYGRQDGYLLFVDAQGKVLGQLLLDEPILCLTGLHSADGTPVALVGTTHTLRRIRLENMTETWRRSGEYQKLTVACRHGKQIAVAVRRTGEIEAFTP